jgi:hypothetical protein
LFVYSGGNKEIRVMNNIEKISLANSLQIFLDESEQMWKEGKPHAQIVGFLQGTIKTVIVVLEDTEK